MGEAIISRFSTAEDQNSIKMGWKLYTQVVNANISFSVPTCKNQELHVMIFGGGGGAGVSMNTKNAVFSAGGGGGNMNQGIIVLDAGSVIPITIGDGGALNTNGGTTSFGAYLSASGVEAGKSLWSTYDANHTHGGNGGSGGGTFDGYGGHGVYGGGGGSYRMNYPGGNGGRYGGQGGHGFSLTWIEDNRYDNSISCNIENSSGLGKGGYVKIGSLLRNQISLIPSSPGVIPVNENIVFNFGLDTNKLYNLANGGNSFINYYTASDGSAFLYFATGGGGGWGGRGGDGVGNYYSVASGGGGGYYANGGNGAYHYYNGYSGIGTGGGGGYGHKGNDGFTDGRWNHVGGGGGGYGPLGYASGGTYYHQNSGNSGICIIQYYGIVYE